MPHTILVVDDELNVTLVKFGLSQARYKVLVAHDGDEALTVARQQKPHLIVLDVMMPKMSGFEFMNELKVDQVLNTIPVIMLTANENMEGLFKLEGVKGYFVKPVNLKKMVDKIQSILGENPF